MKYICRSCLKETADLNFVVLNSDELCQIRIQLSICVPEMVVDLVKDPVFCKCCVSALDSAYNFKNQCLQTEEHILNYKRKILNSKSIDIIDLLHDLRQTTRNGACEDDGERNNTRKNDFRATPNINLLLTDENLVNRQNLETESYTGQHSITLITSAIQTTSNTFNSLLDDPLRITPIQLRVFKQEGANDDITIKEEDIPLPKVESSSLYEGFEDSLFEDAESEDRTADVKSMGNNSATLQDEGEDGSRDIKIKEENRHKPVLKKLSKNENSTKRFYCASCKYHTAYKRNLKAHIRTHIGEKPFACNLCKYRSATRSSLQEHLRIHTGEKPFACNVCNFSSARKASLLAHLRIHTGEKPFGCNMCNLRFTQKSHLRDHQLVHTGEKRFACNVCSFLFARKSTLQKHLRIHTGEKPFACNVCTFRTAQKSSLQKHLQVHTGEKPFTCNLCTYCCSRKSNLQRHLQIHLREKDS